MGFSCRTARVLVVGFAARAIVACSENETAGPPNAGSSPPPPEAPATCRTIVRDVEIRCPFHPVDGDRHTMTFTDLDDGSVRLADAADAASGQSDILFDPLQPLGWSTVVTVISPALDRALTAKKRVDCAGVTQCLTTLWYVYRDANDPTQAGDDEWVHVNVSSLGLAQPYEAHGWSTWLHNDLALFNALSAPNGTGWVTRQDDNTPQIYALRLTGAPHVELFAPEKLEDENCLTGRVNAQPPRRADRCFDGQRVSIVRRCYNEPVSAASYALHNVRDVDDPDSGACVAGAQINVPVLRTYVMEVDAFCEPKKPFSQLTPAHVPASAPENRSMGVTPEWGDMLSAISADGNYLALGVNQVDPTLLATTDCPGFRHNVADPADPLSGNATRRTHVCELDDSLQCVAAPIPAPTDFSPIEDLAAAGFLVAPAAGTQSLVVNRVFAPFGEPGLTDVARVDLDAGALSVTPYAFGPATGVAPIRPATE